MKIVKKLYIYQTHGGNPTIYCNESYGKKYDSNEINIYNEIINQVSNDPIEEGSSIYISPHFPLLKGNIDSSKYNIFSNINNKEYKYIIIDVDLVENIFISSLSKCLLFDEGDNYYQAIRLHTESKKVFDSIVDKSNIYGVNDHLGNLKKDYSVWTEEQLLLFNTVINAKIFEFILSLKDILKKRPDVVLVNSKVILSKELPKFNTDNFKNIYAMLQSSDDSLGKEIIAGMDYDTSIIFVFVYYLLLGESFSRYKDNDSAKWKEWWKRAKKEYPGLFSSRYKYGNYPCYASVLKDLTKTNILTKSDVEFIHKLIVTLLFDE